MAFEINFATQEGQAKVERLATSVDRISRNATQASRELQKMADTLKNSAAAFKGLGGLTGSFKKMRQHMTGLSTEIEKVAKASGKLRTLGSDLNVKKINAAKTAVSDYMRSLQAVLQPMQSFLKTNRTGANDLQTFISRVAKASTQAATAAKSYLAWARALDAAKRSYVAFMNAQSKPAITQGKFSAPGKGGVDRQQAANTRMLNANMVALAGTVDKLSKHLDVNTATMARNAVQMNTQAVATQRVTTAAQKQATVQKKTNGVTKQASKDLESFLKMAHGADQATAAMRASLNAMGTHMGIFTGRTILAASAFYGFVTALTTMLTVGSDFSKEMIRAIAIMGATTEEAEVLEKRVRTLARTTVFTGVEAAQGLQFLAMTGLNAREAFYALEPALNIAKIGMIGFGEAADIVTNVMRAFVLPVEDVARVADVLAVAITSSPATITQFAQSLSYVAPIAAAAGDSLENTSAILTVFHDVGIKASRAGTSLRRAYSNLLNPTKKMRGVLHNLGVVTVDNNGHMRGMIDIMQDLAEKGATAADMVKLFGVRAAPAMVNLLRDLRQVNPKVKEQQEAMMGAAGAAASLGKNIEQYLGADARKMISALHDKMIEVFQINEGDLRAILQNLTKQIRNFDVARLSGLIDTLKNSVDSLRRKLELLIDVFKIIAFTTLLRMFGSVVATIAKVMAGFGHVITAAAGALGKYVTAVTAAGVATKAVNGVNSMWMTNIAKQNVMTGAAAANTTMWGKALGTAGKWTGRFGRLLAGATTPLGMLVTGLTIGLPLLYDWAAGYVEASDKTKDMSEKLAEYNLKLEKTIELEKVRAGLSVGKSVAQTLNEAGLHGERPDPLTGGTKNEMSEVANSMTANIHKVREHDKALQDTFNRIRDLRRERDAALAVQQNSNNPHKEQALAHIRSGYAREEAALMEVFQATRRKREELQQTVDVQWGQLQEFNESLRTPSGTKALQQMQDRFDKVSGKGELEATIKDSLRAFEKEKDRINHLEDIGLTVDPLEARDQVITAAQKQGERITKEFEAQRSAVMTELKAMADDLNIQVSDEGLLQTDRLNTIVDPARTEALVAMSSKIQEMSLAYRDAMQQLQQAKRDAQVELSSDIVSEGKFANAAEEVAKQTRKVEQNIEAIRAKAEIDRYSTKLLGQYSSASERAYYFEQQRLLVAQAQALQFAVNNGFAQEEIDALHEKASQLAKNLELYRQQLQIQSELKKQQQAQKEHDSEVKRLSRGSFFKGDSKIEFDRAKDLEDLAAYYMKVKGLRQEDLDGHAEYMQAKQEIEAHYWLKQHEQVDTFFNSMSDNLARNISEVFTYQQSWEEAARNIRGAIIGSIVGGLVEVGVEQMKQWVITKFVENAKRTETAATVTAQVVGEQTKTAAAQASGTAQAAATGQASGAIGALIGQGAALAAAWMPAAYAVTLASYGANAAPAVTAFASAAGGVATSLGIVTAATIASQAAIAALGGGNATARAMGGDIKAGEVYRVGELGTEAFVAGADGHMISNSQLRQMENQQQQEKADPFADSSGGQGEGGVRIINAIDPAIIDDYLGSDSAERIIVNIMKRNKR